MATIGRKRTTVEIPVELYEAAKDHAPKTGRPVRMLIEDGIRIAREAERRGVGFKLRLFRSRARLSSAAS